MKEQNRAHAVLNYIINKAIVEAKTGVYKIRLSFADLCNEFEDIDFEPSTSNADLVIIFESQFDSSKEIIPEEQFLGSEENDDDAAETEEATEFGRNADKDKESH